MGVCQNLLSAERRNGFLTEVASDYAQVRERTAKGRGNRPLRLFAEAKARALTWNWQDYQPPRPTFLGVRPFDDFPIRELIPYIDWTPFFRTWELAGRFPAILEDEVVGEAARDVYRDARQALAEIVRDGLLTRARRGWILAGESGWRGHRALGR